MINVAVLLYGLLCSFVLSSIGNNRRANRAHGQTLVLVGWSLMSTSFTAAVLLVALAAGQSFGS